MTGCLARRRELGRVLRSYRDLLGPEQVGLPVGGRRRAPGLRREEVAELAGVGLSWYTWLEQGRVVASDQVLESVGRVLGIDDIGREHLRALSRPAGPRAPGPASLRPLLDSWPSDPAVLLDARMDVVAANTAWRDVWGPAGDHVLLRLAGHGAASRASDARAAGALSGPGGPVAPTGGRGTARIAGLPAPDALGDEPGAPLPVPPRHARVGDPSALVHALARRFRMLTDLDPVDARLAHVRRQVRHAAPAFGPVWDCRGVGSFGRPTIRVDGTERLAHLLGDAGATDVASPTVLVLLPA